MGNSMRMDKVIDNRLQLNPGRISLTRWGLNKRPEQNSCHLSHWGQVTHICVSNLPIIGSDNDLAPGWCQAIIWTNAGLLLIWSLGTNFGEIFKQNSYIFIQENAFENVVWEISTILSRPQCVNRWHFQMQNPLEWIEHLFTSIITQNTWECMSSMPHNPLMWCNTS